MKPTLHHRGNAGVMHNIVQDMLVDILERKGRKVRKEFEVCSKVEYGKFWVIDVADITDAAHPIYYEVQAGRNESFNAKLTEIGLGTGWDLVPLYLDELEKEHGKNVGVQTLRKWIEERIT